MKFINSLLGYCYLVNNLGFVFVMKYKLGLAKEDIDFVTDGLID